MLSGAETIFESGSFPTLLYSVRQEFGRERHDRPMHRHTSLCELLLCYQGFGTYYVGDTSYQIEKGDVIFGNVGEMHEVVSDLYAEIGTYCFGIGGVHFQGLPENYLIPADSAHVRGCGDRFPFFETLCAQINLLYAGGPGDRLTAQCLLSALVLQSVALLDDKEQRTLSSTERLGTRIKAYIDEHYTEPITLPLLAEKMGCSPNYVSHAFQQSFGYPPIQYTIRRRIGLAQTWLISSDLSATEIAGKVGYDNPNHFQVMFARVVGMSPIRYRKQYLETLRGERSQH